MDSCVFCHGCHLNSTRCFNCLLPAQPSPHKHVTCFSSQGESPLLFSIFALMLPLAPCKQPPVLNTDCIQNYRSFVNEVTHSAIMVLGYIKK